jgi:hypothetical protein
MLEWQKVPPGDRLGVWTAIAIMASAMEHDETSPRGIQTAINSVMQLMRDGMELEIGWYQDEPVAMMLVDSSTFVVHVLPYARSSGAEYAAWYHAFAEARDRSSYGLSYYADHEKQYEWALAEGFRADDEDQFADQHLWWPKPESAIVV